jgi:hypothetical protein
VQIVEKRGGVRRILELVGSAHSDFELAVLIRDARERLHAGQQALDLDLDSVLGTAAGEPARAASSFRSARRCGLPKPFDVDLDTSEFDLPRA